MVVTLHEFSEEDFKPLETIVEKEWEFHLYSNDWRPLTHEYIEEMIAKSDFVKVVKSEGTTVGIVCASKTLPEAESYEDQDSELPAYEKERRMFDRIDEELRQTADQNGMGELVLIIIDSSVKKKGIGRFLVSEVTNYLARAGCAGMFISTDTDCDYRFYEHLDCELLGSRECKSQGSIIVRYLYRKMFDRPDYNQADRTS